MRRRNLYISLSDFNLNSSNEESNESEEIDDIIMHSDKYLYVIINKCYGAYEISDVARKFISTYRNIEYNLTDLDGLHRHDPVLVLTVALLGKISRTKYSKLKIKKLIILQNNSYIIVDNDGIETIQITNNNFTFLRQRPHDFFKQISKFCRKKNIKLDMSLVPYFPKEGNYRIFD
jgi:hypothetical protein